MSTALKNKAAVAALAALTISATSLDAKTTNSNDTYKSTDIMSILRDDNSFSSNSLIGTANDPLLNQGYGIESYSYHESFEVLGGSTHLSEELFADIERAKQIREARAAEAQSFASEFITSLGTNADGDSVFRISAPDPEAMSIHTPFRGLQVNDSDTYVVEGVLGTEVITFKGLDIDQYLGEQMIDSHGREAGDQYILGELIEEGKGRGSENARFFITPSEIQAGIGFPMLEDGDWVQGTSIIIQNDSGAREFDVSDYIMDAERMAELGVKAGGDGKMPTDYVVIALTEGSDELRAEIIAELAKPGGSIKFAADSHLGTRWTTEPTTFGEHWARDVAAANEIKENGAQYNVPLSETFERIVSTDFSEQLDHSVSSCKYLGVDADAVENYDFYAANLDEFAGMYPRDSHAVFATLAGTHDIVAFGEPNMVGVNVENVESTGVTWSQTGSANNVSIVMTPEDLRELSHGCNVDNNGATPTPFTPYASTTTSGFGPGGSFNTTAGLFSGGGGYGGYGGGGGGSTTTTTALAPVPLPGPLPLLIAGLGALALVRKFKGAATTTAAAAVVAVGMSGAPANDVAPEQFTYDVA